MGLFTKVKRRDIKPGDHIYTYRAVHNYTHHGIYVGENKVIHFTSRHKGYSGFTSENINGEISCSNTPGCGFHNPGIGVFVICLDCFLRKGSLYRYEYGVSAFDYLGNSPASCTRAQSDPPERVIHRANYLLQNGFGNYNIFKNNCEDFALYCKTELWLMNWESEGRSGQIKRLSFMGSLYRYSRDIGVRRDVFKVAAEDLPLNLGCGKIMDEENIKKMNALKLKTNALRRELLWRLW